MDCRLCSWLNLSRPDGWVKPDSYMRGQIQPYPCCALLFLIPPSISAHSLLPAVEILGLKDDANELPIHGRPRVDHGVLVIEEHECPKLLVVIHCRSPSLRN